MVPQSSRDQRILAALLASIADQENVGETAGDVKANVTGQLKLKDVKCPTCGAEQKIEGLKLRTASGFSKLKCKAKDCGEVALSSLWRCRCNLLWTRCPRHVHEVQTSVKRSRKDNTIRKIREATYGVVRPQPVHRGPQGNRDEGTDPSTDEQQPGHAKSSTAAGSSGDKRILATPPAEEPASQSSSAKLKTAEKWH